MTTDFRSVEDLRVYKNKEYVANLQRTPKGCVFRYTREFLESNQEPIALHLPKSEGGLIVEGLANLPTYFAGLLPEGVMFSAVRRLIGAAADDLFAVLAATGADAIGDIDTRIPGEPERKPNINLAQATEQIRSLLSNSGTFRMDHLAAISGAQPKMSLGQLVRSSRGSTFIAKFESPEFPKLIENEFIFTNLARRCRLEVPTATLRAGALVTKRFDRRFDIDTNQTQKLHVEDMLQVMDMFPNSKYSMEYADLMRAMQELGVSKATLLDAVKLYVFSYIIGNGDLHAKNVSLIFDDRDRQWRISPAYDLLSTLPYASQLEGADHMALALADESFGRFTVSEFVDFGPKFGLPEKAVKLMIHRTAALVLRHLDLVNRSYLESSVAEIIRCRAESLIVE